MRETSMPTGAVSQLCRKQLGKLRAEAEPILFRAAEVGARAAAQERADKFVAAARDAIASWPEKKPWIEDKERKAASKQVRACLTGPPLFAERPAAAQAPVAAERRRSDVFTLQARQCTLQKADTSLHNHLAKRLLAAARKH